MIRPRPDLDDDIDSLFDREEAQERRRVTAVDREVASERLAQMQAQDAEMKKRARESMRGTSAAFVVREYRNAGVEPPSVDPSGNPTCSLSLLKKMGWRIEEFAGEKVLVAPPAPPTWDGPRDWDSLPKTPTEKSK